MMPNKRDWEIRQLLRTKLRAQLREPFGGLGLQRPILDRRTQQLTIKTKSDQTIKQGDQPQGVVFKDGSFLTLLEIWSKEGELLYFSYHYQRPDPSRWRFFRYDRELPEPPPVDKPRHHLHVNSHLHFVTGPVELEHVLDVIAELFRRQAEGEDVL